MRPRQARQGRSPSSDRGLREDEGPRQARQGRSPSSDKASQSSIRAVFFDIGNVLLRFHAGQVVRRMAAALGLHPLRVARIALSGSLTDSIERGELDGRTLHGMFREQLGFSGTPREFKRLWCDHFTPEPGTHALLRRVSGRCKVFLLSNTNRLHYDFIRANFEFPKRVHGAVLSYRLGMRKPEPRIYREALRRAGCRPEEAFFVDDLEENVRAAEAVGMRAMRYTGAADLERELKSLRVL